MNAIVPFQAYKRRKIAGKVVTMPVFASVVLLVCGCAFLISGGRFIRQLNDGANLENDNSRRSRSLNKVGFPISLDNFVNTPVSQIQSKTFSPIFPQLRITPALFAQAARCIMLSGCLHLLNGLASWSFGLSPARKVQGVDPPLLRH